MLPLAMIVRHVLEGMFAKGYTFAERLRPQMHLMDLWHLACSSVRDNRGSL